MKLVDMTTAQIAAALETDVVSECDIETMLSDLRVSVRKLATAAIRRRQALAAEEQRLLNLKLREVELSRLGYRLIAGVDEAGRGPLAGPVVAAAVILPPDCRIPRVNDSKQLTGEVRKELAAQIKEKAISWSVGIRDVAYINRYNILNADKAAMLDAIGSLHPGPDYVLIDAVKLDIGVPCEPVIHGDALIHAISAASIIAKTTRDAMMTELDDIYPGYGFAEHKGYATREHYAALDRLGPCSLHRSLFLRNWRAENSCQVVPEGATAPSHES
jgi:ribonuclease HII